MDQNRYKSRKQQRRFENKLKTIKRDKPQRPAQFKKRAA